MSLLVCPSGYDVRAELVQAVQRGMWPRRGGKGVCFFGESCRSHLRCAKPPNAICRLLELVWRHTANRLNQLHTKCVCVHDNTTLECGDSSPLLDFWIPRCRCPCHPKIQ